MDVDLLQTCDEQPPRTPLMLDISGDPESPVPVAVAGSQCACCGLWIDTLWQGARAANPDAHAVCTLCYLSGHLDSPTAAHGLLRAVMTILLLAGLGGVGFVKTLVATYRLWQLQTRRVSESEGGTFQDFHAGTRWFRKVLTLGQFND